MKKMLRIWFLFVKLKQIKDHYSNGLNKTQNETNSS